MPTPSRLVRVFISSTFRDFIEERDELVKKVFPELRRRCKERFVEVLEVDLRWGITEEQSKSGETLRICLEEIDRCRPSAPVFFVGLLGERYGWIPPRDYFKPDVLEDPNLGWVKEHIDGKSVTELEILHGVLRNETMRDKSFFYFRNDGYQDRHWDAITSHHAGIVPPLTKEDFTNSKSPTPEADSAKQRDLKQRVRDVSFKWEPKDYETPKDLASLILEDLWTAINLIFPASSVPDALERESLEHAAFGQSRTKGYVPRAGLFEQLDKVLSADTVAKVVIGESGGGKSALLAAWLKARENQIPQKTFTHFIGGTPESGSAEGIVRRLMATIREWGAVSEPIPEDLGDAVRVLPEWLAIAGDAEKHGVLLVLDALNQLENESERSLWWLPTELPRGVKLLASTLPGPAEDALRKRGFLKDAVVVPPLQDDEKRTIITKYLGTFSKGIATNLADRLAGAPQCANPLFLRVILDELRLRARHENLSQSLDRMLEANDSSELYVQVLKSLEEFDRARPNLVRESMGYLATARRGLTESELLQLLSDSENPSTSPLPRQIWSPLYLALEDSLVSRNGRLGFFHDYLRQAVEREYLDEDWERKKIHGRFGEVAEACFTDRFSPSLRNYGLSHGAWHLRLANNHERLWQLLSSTDYLAAQAKEFNRQHESIAALRNGVLLFAERDGQEIEDDQRLCKLVLMCGATAENARSSLLVIFTEFAAAPLADFGRVERAFEKLSIIPEDLLFSAGQILLLRECERAIKESTPADRKALVKILERMEKGVPNDTIVPCNSQLEERLAELMPLDLWLRMALISDKVPQGTEIQQEVWPNEAERWNASSRLTLYTVDGWRGLFCARTLARLKRWDDIEWLLSEGREKHFGLFKEAIQETLVEGLIRAGLYRRAEVLLEKLSKSEGRACLLCLLAEKLPDDAPNEIKRIARTLSNSVLESVDKSTLGNHRNFADNPFIVVLRTIRILRNYNLTEEFFGTISKAKSLVLEFEHEEAKIKFLLAFVDFLIEIELTKDAEEMASHATRIIESTNTSEIQWFDPDSILDLARILTSIDKPDEARRVADFIKETENRKRNSWRDEKSRDEATSVLRVRIAILAQSNEALDCERWKLLLKETMSLESFYAFQGLNDCLEKALETLKGQDATEFLNFFFQECLAFFEGLDHSPEEALLAFGKIARACIDGGDIGQAYKMLGLTFSKGAKIGDLVKSFNERIAELCAFRDKLLKIDQTNKTQIYDWGKAFLLSQRDYYRENQVYHDPYEDIPIRSLLLGLVAVNYLSIDEKILADEVLDESLALLDKTDLVEAKAMMFHAIAGLLAGQAYRSDRYLEFWVRGLETSSAKGRKLLNITLLSNIISPMLENGCVGGVLKMLNFFNQEGPYKQIYIAKFKYDIINLINCYFAYRDLSLQEPLDVSEFFYNFGEDTYTIILFLSARIRHACKSENWTSAIADLDLFPDDYQYEKCISRVAIACSLLECKNAHGKEQLDLSAKECLEILASESNHGYSHLGLCAVAKLFEVAVRHDSKLAQNAFQALLDAIPKLENISLCGIGPDSNENEPWTKIVARALRGQKDFAACAFFEGLLGGLEKMEKINSDNIIHIFASICGTDPYKGYEDHLTKLYHYCLNTEFQYCSQELIICELATLLLDLPILTPGLNEVIDQVLDKYPRNEKIAKSLLKSQRIDAYLKYHYGVYPQSWANYVKDLCEGGLIVEAQNFIHKIEKDSTNNKEYSISEENILASKLYVALALEKQGKDPTLSLSLLLGKIQLASHFFIFLHFLMLFHLETFKHFLPKILQRASKILSDDRAKIHAIAGLSMALCGLEDDAEQEFRQAVRISQQPRIFGNGKVVPLDKKERNQCMEFIVAAYNSSQLQGTGFFDEIRVTLLSESNFEFLLKLNKGYYAETGWQEGSNAELGFVHDLEIQRDNQTLQASRCRQMMTLCPSNPEINFEVLGHFLASIIKQNDMKRLKAIAESSPNLSWLNFFKFDATPTHQFDRPLSKAAP